MWFYSRDRFCATIRITIDRGRESITISTQTSQSKVVVNSVVLAALLAGFGCTSLGFGVRERAESAFRKQNRLTSEFMLVAPDIESKAPAMYESLLDKEKSMLDACLPLNTLAAMRRDNEIADLDEKKAIVSSLQACEQATSDFDEGLQDALHQTTKQ